MMPVRKTESFVLPERMRGLQPTLIRQFFERALPDSINFGLRRARSADAANFCEMRRHVSRSRSRTDTRRIPAFRLCGR